MGELEDFDIKRGSHIIVYDVLQDYKICHEATVVDFKIIHGTNRVRIICDPPLWIECTKVD